jgi:hypothetical protein
MTAAAARQDCRDRLRIICGPEACSQPSPSNGPRSQAHGSDLHTGVPPSTGRRHRRASSSVHRLSQRDQPVTRRPPLDVPDVNVHTRGMRRSLTRRARWLTPAGHVPQRDGFAPHDLAVLRPLQSPGLPRRRSSGSATSTNPRRSMSSRRRRPDASAAMVASSTTGDEPSCTPLAVTPPPPKPDSARGTPPKKQRLAARMGTDPLRRRCQTPLSSVTAARWRVSHGPAVRRS